MEYITKENILTFHKPENALPVIFDSPHSGRIYPTDFNYSCDTHTLKSIEDHYVDELFNAAPNNNTILLTALFPRSYIDTNRASDDIDENLLGEQWPFQSFGSIRPTSRSDSGIGLIYRLIKPGTAIYNRPLTPQEIMNRIKNYYEPYHDTLCTALNDAYYAYGQFWHINCHSMPASSAYPKHQITLLGHKQQPSDIVLSDRDGKTCSREFLYTLRDFWRKKGLRVTINDPFKGVELIERYAQPTRGKNSIQIEINRVLYMNEATGAKSKNFETIQNHCTDMIKHCSTFARANLTNMAAD